MACRYTLNVPTVHDSKGELMTARILSLILFCVTCHAGTLVLDQGFDTGIQGGNSVVEGQWLWQSFEVGVEGTLQEVQLHLFRGGLFLDDLTAWITLEGTLDYVATASIPRGDIPLWPAGTPGGSMVTVDFGNEAPDLQLGSRFDILLTSLQPTSGVNWTRDLSDPYLAGGAGALFQAPGIDRRTTFSADHTFQTFMDPGVVAAPPTVLGQVPRLTPPIPEPSGLLMITIAFASLHCGSRCRYRDPIRPVENHL